jgi:ribose transport system substrate-binding protein
VFVRSARPDRDQATSREDSMKTNRPHSIVIGMLIAVAGLAAAGVGMAASRTASAQPDLAYVNAQLDKASALPEFVAPGPAIDVSKLRGKVIFNIPVSSSIPFVQGIDQAMADVARRVGVKFIEYPNQGQPSQWVAGIDQAIARHADLIVLEAAPNPAVLQPQIDAARRAGIPTLVTHLHDVSQKPPSDVTVVPVEFARATRLDVDWIVEDTKGKADVLFIQSAELVNAAPMVAAMKDEFARRCGSGCKYRIVNVPVVDWATKIQSQVATAIVRDPNLNYVLPMVDSMSQFVAPAITAAGKVGKVHVASYNGTPFVMRMLQEGDIVSMDVGENLQWLGWANMDQAFRLLLKAKPVRTENTALRVFTKSNIREAGTPPKINVGYGSAYVTGYEKLWGLR